MAQKGQESARSGPLIAIAALVAAVVLGWMLWPSSQGESAAPGSDSGADVAEDSGQRDDKAAGNNNRDSFFNFDKSESDADGGEADAVTGVDPGPFNVTAVERALDRIDFDDAGNLVIDREARTVLERAFEGLERELTEEELDRLGSLIKERVPGQAGQQVAGIVRDYHDYQVAMDELEQPQSVADEDTRLDKLSALRRKHLGPEVAVRFYADDEAYRRYLVDRVKIAKQDDLSPQEQRDRQNELQSDMLAGVTYLDDSDSEAAKSLRQNVERLKESGASQDYIEQVRSQTLGLEEARDLERSPQAQQEWESSYAKYKEEKQALLSAGLSESDKQAQLDSLVDRYFGEQEKSLVEAYRAE